MTDRNNTFCTIFLENKYIPISFSRHTYDRKYIYNIIFIRIDVIEPDPEDPQYINTLQPIDQSEHFVLDILPKTMLLENNQKTVPTNIKGVIYIIKSPKDIDGIYRLGKTDDFKKRLQNYNSANSDKMKIIKIYLTAIGINQTYLKYNLEY